jgi:dihydroorotase/N-acyl-D-amino-acid deacylase
VDRRANPEEMARMSGLVRQGMAEGAFGLSSGLFYLPGTFAPKEEVVALARVAAEAGGIYITHMRDEAAGVLESVRETIAIGEGAGLPAQITHHKVIGPAQKGMSRESLRLVEEARARGVDVTMDAYPYMAGRTGLDSLLPVWAREGGRQAMLARFADPAQRAKIVAGVVENLRNDRGAGNPANVQISYSPREPELAGKTLAEITRGRGRGPGFEPAAETVLEILEKSFVRAIFHSMAPEDVERIVVHPWTMIASDGEVVTADTAQHPRSYGTFARVLGEYVRERKLLTLEEAVRKMTSFPAARLNLSDRGLVMPGMKADLVVFDPERVADRSTYEKPHEYAEGFSHVIVNGQLVLDDGKMTGTRPGRVLYGPGYSRAGGALSGIPSH